MKNIPVGMFWVVASVAAAQNPHAVLDRYLTDDVVAVGYLDLAAADIPAVLEWGEELDVLTAGDRDAMADTVKATQMWLDHLAAFGAEHGYVLFRVSDVGHRGPSWVVPVSKQGKKPQLPGHWEIVDSVLLGGTTVAQLDQLKNRRPGKTSRDLSKAWAALGQGDCGLLVFGDKDSRRVVREMFPKLPGPFQAIDGKLIADGLLWGGIALDLPPKPRAQIVVETRDEATAAAVAEAATSALGFIKQAVPAKKELIEALASTFRPQVEGKRVRISLDELTSDVDRMTKLLSPPIRAARQAAQRRTRMNKVKQIGLGMHNYHSARGTFPSRSTYSDNEKPLLSWRVQILPYLGQGKLYDQFHLDEPWDSKHNLALVAKMPSIYADPDMALRKVNAQGKTTYVVPTSEGTVFDRPVGTQIKEINDGTSNTIMLVEVVPERAVVWTKPEDWAVDLDHPWRGVRRNDRDWFTTGFCDGSARILSSSLSAEKLRALLTRDGGEVIEYP